MCNICFLNYLVFNNIGNSICEFINFAYFNGDNVFTMQDIRTISSKYKYTLFNLDHIASVESI
jgi:hypothetical protein